MALVNSWPQNAVIYQIYPRSFKDSNNDGIGDIPGIREKLDYLKELGINTIWISPFFTSPMKDFGYDVSDYCDIEPMFGTLADFDNLAKEIHKRDMKILLDYIPSHTSTEHPWFLESKSSKTNPKRDWYIWKDPRPDGSVPNNWISPFGGSTWEYDKQAKQYYLHTFVKEQADLNWRNLEVQDAMIKVLRFWLEKGVDGFRVDAFNHIFKDELFADEPANPAYVANKHDPFESLLHIRMMNQPELTRLIKRFSTLLTEYGDKFMVTESYIQLPQLLTFYRAGNYLHAPFNFQFIQLPWHANRFKTFVDKFDKGVGGKHLPTYVLGNHDRHRVASRIGSQAARVAALMQLTLRGAPTIYYGEELGMTDVTIPLERVQDPWEKNVPGMGLGRDPERTPMQWNIEKYAGFSKAEPWLPIPESAKMYNVEKELKDPQSILTLYKRLLEIRQKSPVLIIGTYSSFDLGTIPVFAYQRKAKEETFIVILNFSNKEQHVQLPGKQAHIALNTFLDKKPHTLIDLTNLSLRPNEGYLIQV